MEYLTPINNLTCEKQDIELINNWIIGKEIEIAINLFKPYLKKVFNNALLKRILSLTIREAIVKLI